MTIHSPPTPDIPDSDNHMVIHWPTAEFSRGGNHHSRDYYTIRGCVRDGQWLYENRHLVSTFIQQRYSQEQIDTHCTSIRIASHRIMGHDHDYEIFLQQLVKEVVTSSKQDEFMHPFVEEFSQWLTRLMKPKLKVFISHTKSGPLNLNLARKLRDDLVSSDISVWFDEDSILTSDSIPDAVSGGIATSDFFLMILTKGYLRSSWVKSEIWQTIYQHTQGAGLRVIPCLAETCPVPDFLADLKYADFTSEYQFGLNELLGMMNES